MDFKDIYRIDVYCEAEHPSASQYTFFSAAHGTFSKIGPILDIKQV
jgi:hypothetical protein